MSGFLKSRQAREGGYSAVYVLVFVAIVGAVNYLADQYNKTYDATELKLYSLSDQTHKILNELENDVTIYHFDRKVDFAAARNSLVRYENASNNVAVNYIDPDSDPAQAQIMNIRTYGTTLIEIAGAREEADSTSEEDVTNAIIQAIKGREKTACIMTGHGEANVEDNEREGFSVAQNEIEGANYETQTLSLLENPHIPTECTLVIVGGPEAGYLEPEVDILRGYVEQGGRLLMMLEHTKSPELVELAAMWGIEVKDDVVINLSGIGQLFGGSPLTPIVAEYDSFHPITEVMGNVAAFFPMVRTVVEGTEPDGWSVTELMKTTEGSFATSKLDVVEGELRRDPANETEGPINIVVAAEYDVPDEAPAGDDAEAGAEIAQDEEEKQGRVVVVGTARFARNYFVGRGGNLDVFLNILNWLSSDEDLISIRPKDPESTPMDITERQMTNIFLGLLVGLPLIIVGAGVRMWWLRR